MNREGYVLAFILLATAACTGTLDAGRDSTHGLLPVDNRSPIVLCNDGPTDNWQGEYAILFSKFGGPKLVGIIVNDSPAWPTLSANVAGWQDMISAAKSSGITDLPDVTASRSDFKIRPSDGLIDSTVPTASAGAQLIVSAAQAYAETDRPLVVVTGARLTDIADAYLLERSIAERIIVVSSLGSLTDTGALMDSPNGEMDYWADIIVSSRLRYVQVSRFYTQTMDVPTTRLAELPENAFGSWIAAKQPRILERDVAADQVAVLSVAASQFVTKLEPVVAANQDGSTLLLPPPLLYDSTGQIKLVTEFDETLPSRRLWEMLGEL